MTVLNIYKLNMGVPIYELFIEANKKINPNRVAVGDLAALLSPTDRPF